MNLESQNFQTSLVRILEGEFPDPGEPDVVSIWIVGEVEEVGDTTSHAGFDLLLSLVRL
jgi:hypothetical protein